MSPGHHADESEKYRANEVRDAGQFEAERLKLGEGVHVVVDFLPGLGCAGRFAESRLNAL